MGFTAIGYNTRLKMKGRRSLAIPKSLVMLFDFEGEVWPRTSVLFGNRPEGKPSRPGRSRYFGQGYETLSANYEIIPGDRMMLVNLDNWKFVGEVHEIWYDRALEHPERWGGIKPSKTPDTKNPKGFLHHVFQKFEAPPGLFKRGRYYRLELLPGTRFNMRGFVEPGQ